MIEKNHKSMGLAYLSVILVALLIELLFSGFSLHALWNLIENIFFAAILVLLQLFFRKSRYAYVVFVILFSVFVITVYFESVYYYLFETIFTPSAIFVTLDSNYHEAKEFLDFYLNGKVAVMSVVFILLLAYGILSNRGVKNISSIPTIYTSKIKVILILLILVFLKFSKLIVYNLPYLLVKSTIGYVTEMKVLDNYKNNKTGAFHEVKRERDDDEELYVIVLGESTGRSHLSLYGYYRKTTPRLDSIAKDLLIYQDVISPHAYSTASLTKALTLGNYESPKNVGKGSIIQLINTVGFETYWLSNQRPIGPYESSISKIGLSSSNHAFTNTIIAGHSNVLDGVLVDEFDNAIRENKKKKVVFLHLLGTHHHYENRYPESFNRFKTEPLTNYKSDDNFEKINHYDNAVLYNDFIISEVIKKVENLNIKSVVLYVSDHGEEVFDTMDMAGHNEDIYSQPMFDVPFFLWQSDKYKASKQIPFIKNRRYMIDDLFHSISDLLSIKAEEVKLERSIFSEDFEARDRIIKGTLNYDDYFKN